MSYKNATSENVPCPVCGETDLDVLFTETGYTLGKCRTCRLVRQNPRFTEAAMREQHYDGDVQEYEHGITRGGRYEGLESWETRPRAAYIPTLQLLEQILPDKDTEKSLIDVGCASGGFLLAARERGWKVSGVEIGSKQVHLCRETHDLDVHLGTLREARIPDQQASVLCYRQVLEHIHDLNGELAEVNRILAPGGLLLVEIPHYGGSKYRFDEFRATLGLIRKQDIFHYLPGHLYYFKRHQLFALLNQAGFEPVYTRTYGRWRTRRSPLRTGYEALRDALSLGNKLRVIARKRIGKQDG